MLSLVDKMEYASIIKIAQIYSYGCTHYQISYLCSWVGPKQLLGKMDQESKILQNEFSVKEKLDRASVDTKKRCHIKKNKYSSDLSKLVLKIQTGKSIH